MKIFAHRGWSAGVEENTLAALRKSIEVGIDGVEFDVRPSHDCRSVVLSHDPVTGAATATLEEALDYLKEGPLEILIEMKEYSEKFYALVVEHLRQRNLVGRTTIFAFPKEAEQFPWSDRRDIKLGIIAPYPGDIKKYIRAYNPDMILLGWGNKKERLQFKIAWSFLSLDKAFARYPSIKFVVGVAYTQKDKGWLFKQAGLYGVTADLPLV